MRLCTRIVKHIATEICTPWQSDDNDENQELRDEDTVQIWAHLFSISTKYARPISDEKVNAASMSPSDLKYFILSNLLDCSVNHPNLDMRRQYIGRILQLSKHVQKRLMAMIELRVRRQTRNHTPQKAHSRLATPPKGTPKNSNAEKKTRNRSEQESSASKRDEADADSFYQTPTPTKQNANSSAEMTPPSSARGYSAAFEDGSSTGYTPSTKRQNIRSPEGGFLSPGTMDSPQAIRTIVTSLQQKNKELSHDLALAQRRELEFKTKMDALKQNHRKDMIRLETASMEREQELKKELQGQYDDMEKQIQTLQEEAAKGRKAQEELSKAKDELDVMEKQQSELVEMAERVRKYKEKVAELHDVKEALKREQEAHGRSVEEIVKLETEVKTLHPVKRQLEEYKTRAIEAEVKLVESQDYLRRLEAQAQQATDASDSLFKETVMQKEQMDELIRRIKDETQANMETATTSVADGVSELNPQIQEELVRLRNENLQLRAFAAKRQNDAVEKLEAKLDDIQRLGAKFKDQYLMTKDSLISTQKELQESRAREESLESQVEVLEEQTERLRGQVKEVLNQKEKLQGSFDSMKRAHDSLFTENGHLRDEIQSLQQKLKETFELGTERLEQLRKVTEELGQASKKLELEQTRSRELEETADAWKSNATEIEAHFQKCQGELSTAETKLVNVRKQLDQVQAEVRTLNKQLEMLDSEKSELEKQFDEERQSNIKAMEELEKQHEEQLEEERQTSNKVLESTKEILETKHKQELLEQSLNMNNLLEDERKAARLAREEAQKNLEKVLEDKKKHEEDLRRKLTLSQKELDDTITEMREESRAEIEAAVKKTRKECDAKTNDIVKKGRDMINETKLMLKKEIEAIDEENRGLRDELEDTTLQFKEFKENAIATQKDLKEKFENSVAQINELSTENDELQERLKTVNRDYRRLQEENDLYRRQVGGRFGVDGKLQSQFDNLQKEYNALLDENRQMKHQNRHNHQNTLGNISEAGLLEGTYNSRGATTRSSVVQVRREYEEAISTLNDEKRELLMKHSAAVADVEKAEKRSWEREQENEKLKAELTSLKLELQRAELTRDDRTKFIDSEQSPLQSSFFSAREEEDESMKVSSPPRGRFSGYSPYSAGSHSSPGIDRAKREKAEHEDRLRNQLSNFRTMSPPKPFRNQSFSTSPPTSPSTRASPSRRLAPGVSHLVSSFESKEKPVLSPSRKYENSSNASFFNDQNERTEKWISRLGSFSQ
eukprot:scaffold34701_cov229-Amphora_coffeaeformis.AAC.1